MARSIKTPGASRPTTTPIKTLPAAADTSGLPNAIDIDPTTIVAPVLSRQGWVCPPDRTPAEQAAVVAKANGG